MAVAALREALELLEQPAAHGADRPSKSALLVAADRVKTDAAKFGVMISDGGKVSASESKALLEGLQQSAVAFCALCHACTTDAGPTFSADLKKLATDVVRPCIGLIKALEFDNAKDVKHQVGLIWQGCDAMRKAPMDDKASLFKHMAGVFTVIRDTLREMDELEEEQEEEDDSSEAGSSGQEGDAVPAGSGATGNGQPASTSQAAQPQGESTSGRHDGGGDADADLDFEAGPLSAAEMQVLGACRRLVDVGGCTLKAISKCLLEGPPLQPGDALQGWESVLFHARHLQRCTEDLGAAMYPPQDGADVASAAEALHDTVQFLLDESPAADAMGVQLQALQQQQEEAHRAVQTALQQLDSAGADSGHCDGAAT